MCALNYALAIASLTLHTQQVLLIPKERCLFWTKHQLYGHHGKMLVLLQPNILNYSLSGVFLKWMLVLSAFQTGWVTEVFAPFPDCTYFFPQGLTLWGSSPGFGLVVPADISWASNPKGALLELFCSVFPYPAATTKVGDCSDDTHWLPTVVLPDTRVRRASEDVLQWLGDQERAPGSAWTCARQKGTDSSQKCFREVCSSKQFAEVWVDVALWDTVSGHIGGGLVDGLNDHSGLFQP